MIKTRCAVCQLEDGLVVNVIVASSNDLAPDGCQLVEILNDQQCNIGWYFDGIGFVDPNPPSENQI